MKVPEAMKIEPNMAVVFKKYFDIDGIKANAVVQQEDGTMVFFDTEWMHTDGIMRVAYKDIKGDLCEEVED